MAFRFPPRFGHDFLSMLPHKNGIDLGWAEALVPQFLASHLLAGLGQLEKCWNEIYPLYTSTIFPTINSEISWTISTIFPTASIYPLFEPFMDMFLVDVKGGGNIEGSKSRFGDLFFVVWLGNLGKICVKLCETPLWDCGWQNSCFLSSRSLWKIIWMSSDHERFPYHNVQAYVRPRLNRVIFWDYRFEHALNLHAHCCFMFCQFWLKRHWFLSQFFNAGFHINFWFLRITSLTITNDARCSSNMWYKIVVYIKYITLHYDTLPYLTLPYHTYIHI